MAEIAPRLRRIRRIGLVVFLTVAAVSVPLGIHIQSSWASPELGLTLLGAVLLLVLISLFALETAVNRIPPPRYTEEDAEAADLDPTVMVAPPPDPEPTVPDIADQATELDLSQQTTANPDGPVLVVPNRALALAETRLSDTELNEGEDEDEDEDEDETA